MTRKVIMHTLMTEKTMRISEDENKLVFRVDRGANKNQIKEAVSKQYNVKIESVQTMITAKGEKKAFVKLSEKHNAADIVANMGVL